MNRIILALVVTAVVHAGCKKEEPDASPIRIGPCDTVRECLKMSAPVKFTGFSATELDTIILRKYSYDNNFTTLISEETRLYSKEEINDNTTLNLMINDSFDFMIEVPATGKQFNIHSAHIPLTLDTFKCGEITHYSPPCMSFAPYILVNSDTGQRSVEHLAWGAYRLYLILNK